MFKCSSNWCPRTLGNKIKNITFFSTHSPVHLIFFFFFNPILIMTLLQKSPLVRLLAFPSHGRGRLGHFAVCRNLSAGSGSAGPAPGKLPWVTEGRSLCYQQVAKPTPNPYTSEKGLLCSAALLLCWYNPCYSSYWTGFKTHQVFFFPLTKGQGSGLD